MLLDNIMARRLPVDTYIPGHGPVHVGRGVADLEEQRKYFIVMRDEVSKMIMAGKTRRADPEGIQDAEGVRALQAVRSA